MVDLKFNADLDDAQKQVNAFTDKAAEQMDRIASGAGNAEKGIDKIGDAAKSTAKTLDGMALAEKMERATGKIGDVKDILEKSGKAMFGLSDATVSTIVKVGDLAEKGASLGAAFGPIGAVIGSLTGAVVGYFTSASEKIDEANQKSKEFINEVDKARLAFKNLGSVDIGQVVSQLRELELIIGRTDLDKFKIESLGNLGAAALGKGFEALEKRVSGSNKALDFSGKTLKELDGLTLLAATRQEELENQVKEATEAYESQRDGFGFQSSSLEKHNEILKVLQEKVAANEQRSLALDIATKKLTGSVKISSQASKEDAKSKDESTDSLSKQKEALDRLQKSTKEQADASYQSYLIDKLKRDASGDLITALEIQRKGIEAVANAQKKMADEAAKIEANKLDPISAQLQSITGLSDGASIALNNVGNVVASSIGGKAVDALNAFYDAFADGEERSREDRKRTRVEFARAVGTQLLTDGFGHVLMGAAKAVVPLTRSIGLAEASAGGLEMLAGASLGGVGAIGQRRLGGTAAKADKSSGGSTPSSGSSSLVTGASGPQNLRPVVFNITNQFPSDERGMQEQGKIYKAALDALDRTGGR